MNWRQPMTVSDTPPEHRRNTSESPDGHSPPSPLKNGIIGGVIAVIISFIPLSTMIGGGLAGYMTDAQPEHQLLAGATAGGIAAIPRILVSWYIVASPAIILPGTLLGLGPGAVLAGVIVTTVIYSIGLSVLGSFAGGYLARSQGA